MIKRLLLPLAIAALLAACAARPVQNIADHPIPPVAQSLTPAEIERAIITAGESREWVFKKAEPGHLVATYAKKDFWAAVDIRYTQAAYSITYNTSHNLMDKDGNIHWNYGRWVHNLDHDIETRLIQAAAVK